MYARITAVLLAILLLPLLGSAAPAKAAGVIVIRGTAGPDGLAFIHGVLPPGEYRVVAIEGQVSGQPHRLSTPMLLSFLPDPALWEKLRSLTVAGPLASSPLVRLEKGPGDVTVYAWIPARPGASVEVVLERLGSSSSSQNARPGLVIIVPDDPLLLAAARKIAGIHESQGIDVRVVTTSEIYSHYPEAKPPVTACKELPKGYNESLALRILSFIESLKGSGVKYILLIGGARDVPPIYYCSPTLRELIGRDEGVVPSDYYYADPDGDGVPDFAVGRIPFSDPAMVATYINSLEAWSRGGEWQHKAFLAGGAPFATDLFVGESAVLGVLGEIGGLGLGASELLLSMPGYSATGLQQFIGRYGLYYIVLHGTGSAMLDYVPGGLWNYDFQEKLTADQVPYTSRPGVYLTPACRAAYWDYDLFNPPFTPPSIGVAMLARGAAVAFIGSARVAVEAVDAASLGPSGASLSFAGADAPLQLFFSMLPGSKTLGDAWLHALEAYLSSPKSRYKVYLTSGEEEIGSLVAHEIVFLGDPAAPNPWAEARGSQGSAPALIPPLGSVNIDASVVAMPLARYVTVSLPAYNPGPGETVAFTISHSCPEDLEAEALVRIEGYLLIGLKRIEANASSTGSGCRIVLKVPMESPGLIRVLALWNNTAAAYYLVVGGAYLDRGRGVVVLRGLDVLETIGDEPLLVEVNNTARSILPGGSTSYNVSLSLIAPGHAGAYTVSIRPAYRYDVIYGGKLVEEALSQLKQLYSIQVNETQEASREEGVLGPATPCLEPYPGLGGLGGQNTTAGAGQLAPPSWARYGDAVIALLALIVFLLSLILISRR